MTIQSKVEELETFLKTLKIHNKELDTCFNDALAVRHILELVAETANESKREGIKMSNGDTPDILFINKVKGTRVEQEYYIF